MKISTLKNHNYAQAKIYSYADGSKSLISYKTTVITIDADGWLYVNGLYSRTTIKHIGWFMKEIGFTYQTAKALCNDGKEMNIYTGEIRRV